MIFTFYDVIEFNNHDVMINYFNTTIFIIFCYTIADNNLNKQLKYYCGQKVYNETIVMKQLIFNFEIH